MTFFFDESMSPALGEIARGEFRESAVLHKEHFVGGTKDTPWIQRCGDEGWTIVSTDHAIFENRHQRKVLEESGARAIFLPRRLTNVGFDEAMDWFRAQWPKVSKRFRNTPLVMYFDVSWRGRVKDKVTRKAPQKRGKAARREQKRKAGKPAKRSKRSDASQPAKRKAAKPSEQGDSRCPRDLTSG